MAAKNLKQSLLNGLVFLSLGLVTNHALADVMATATWTLDGSPGSGSPDIDGPSATSVDILDFDSDISGNNVFYHTFGNSGGLFGSRTSGSGVFDITGEFNFSETYQAGPGPVNFDFTVIPGELRNDFFGGTLGAGEEIYASYGLDIRLNGSTIWSSSAELTTTSTGSSLTQSGTSLGTYTPGSNSFGWSTFMDSLLLDVVLDEIFTIEYDLVTTARSNVSSVDCGYFGEFGDDRVPQFIDEEEGEGQGPFGNCASSISRIGDPFGLGGGNMGSVQGATVASVPEPASLILISVGLLGLRFRNSLNR